MNDLRIKNVNISCFRGIKNLKLDLNGRSLILLGENGTGKSSLVNAFDFLFSSKVNALRGSLDIDHDKVIVYKGKNPSDMFVEVEFKNGLKIKRNLLRLYNDKELEPIINSFNQGSFILNRKKLLNFIDAQPKRRYEAMGKLFDLDEMDKIENVLRRTTTNYKKDLISKKREFIKEIANIFNDLNFEPIALPSLTNAYITNNYHIYLKKSKKLINYINSLLENNNLPLINIDDDLNEYLNNFQENLIVNADNVELVNLIEKIDLKFIDKSLREFLNLYNDLTIETFKGAYDLLNVFKVSKQYLASNETDKCPVCSSSINRLELINDLDENIEDLDNNFKLLNEWKNKGNEVISLLNEAVDDLKNIKDYKFDIDEFEFIINNVEDLLNFKKTTFDCNLNVLSDTYQELFSLKVDLIKQNKNTKDDISIINKGLFSINNLKNIKREVYLLEKFLKKSNFIYISYQNEKKEYIKNILTSISDRIIEYYYFLHGDDDIKNPKIEVSASMGFKLKIDSFNEFTDPREYASEGHLDTLGLCIFLAFVREYNVVPFIILDDIITTVDSSHKERVARLLFEKFNDFQIIITTHNKLWYKQIGYICKANSNYRYQQVEIVNWSLEEGPILSINKVNKNLIEKYLKENDLNAAANATRRHLEYITKNICIANEALMYYKEKPSAIEFYKGAKNSINVLTEKTPINDYYNYLFDEINKTRYMANCLSHNDEASEFLTNKEVKSFCDAVFALEKAVICEECGSYIKFNKKNHNGICTNRQCRDSFKFKNLYIL